ncbi:hypothetical protein C7S18_03110 [Ahniella affigens]|uniref:DUF4440 domain-containing protein n=1 Tax=Ahniella affigens TaxID=2021234 RepID=A0A2P1PN21_9GAMM|nr:nuclear transport factor 2 family protein [Ahniella affigens]AVP96241.1 hypothetical protein C7S18_03110 [Ahniella affigens]
MRYQTVLTAILIVGTSACAQMPRSGLDFEASLKAQADAWDAAIVRKDQDAIAANMAARFLAISSAGALSDRDRFIANLTSAELEIDPYTVEEFQIRRFGQAALVTGRTHMTGRYQGKPFQTDYRFTDTYVYESGRWVVANVQTTEVASQ